MPYSAETKYVKSIAAMQMESETKFKMIKDFFLDFMERMIAGI